MSRLYPCRANDKIPRANRSLAYRMLQLPIWSRIPPNLKRVVEINATPPNVLSEAAFWVEVVVVLSTRLNAPDKKVFKLH